MAIRKKPAKRYYLKGWHEGKYYVWSVKPPGLRDLFLEHYDCEEISREEYKEEKPKAGMVRTPRRKRLRRKNV